MAGSLLAAMVLLTGASTGLLAAPTVVVAPLHDASPVADADTVAGVTDLLAAVLAEQVTVVDRQKLKTVLDEQRLSAAGLSDVKTAVRIGGLLKADYLLTGSLFRQSDKIEIVVQLLRIPSGEVAKGITASGAPDKLLDLANDVARQAAAALNAGPAPAAVSTSPSGAAVNPLAEQYFLQALASFHAGDFDRAAMNCLKVIQLDPNNARVRLRLAESFLAAGDLKQARVTMRRTMELFPALPDDARLTAILDRTNPLPLQAVADQPLTVPLPADWAPDDKISYLLSWQDQPAVRDTAVAAKGAVIIKMPPARAPLDLTLDLSTAAGREAKRQIRLWPAATAITALTRPLVTADAASEFEPLLADLPHKRFNSCDSIPDPDRRFVVAPGAASKITAAQAEALTKFVNAGGELVIVGQTPSGTTIAGLSVSPTPWPALKSWTANPQASLLSYLPAIDFTALFARTSSAKLLRGGRPWLSADDGQLALIAEATTGKGRVLWIVWPGPWNPTDPRAARVLALALGEKISLPPPPAKTDAAPPKDKE